MKWFDPNIDDKMIEFALIILAITVVALIGGLCD